MRKSPIRHLFYPLEAALVWALYGVMGLLPINASSWLGGWAARTLGPHLPVSAVAARNLAAVLPELGAEEHQRILRRVWENMGRVAGEFPHIAKLTPGKGHVTILNGHHFTEAQQSGRAAIFFSGHFANWEMLPAGAAEKGTPLGIVYRHANNPYINHLYRFARRRVARNMFSKNRAGAKALLKAIRDKHPIGMLVDQKMNDGISIPLFGRPAMTAPAIAEIALKYDTALYPVRLRRLHGAYFEMELMPALTITPTGHHTEDVKAILTRINQQLEAWIREDPAQWLWLHRRWGKNLDL